MRKDFELVAYVSKIKQTSFEVELYFKLEKEQMTKLSWPIRHPIYPVAAFNYEGEGV